MNPTERRRTRQIVPSLTTRFEFHPPLGNYAILLLKTTTVLYLIGVHEVMFQARLGAGNTFKALAGAHHSLAGKVSDQAQHEPSVSWSAFRDLSPVVIEVSDPLIQPR